MTAYFDHAATSPLRPEAFAAMTPWLTERFGNPSGAHAVARAARTAVDDARDSVAAALGVDSSGVVFTAGGTEADNLAVMGAPGPGAVVTTAIEHHAVLHSVAATGRQVRTVGVGADGTVDLDALGAALDGEVALVSVMAVNNETGVIQPLGEVSRLVRRRAPGALLHTDAVQAVGWLDMAALAAEVDLLSVSAHKFGGPQGMGVLALRRGSLTPLLHGGGQERDRRPGTHNVAGIVGMAAALTTAAGERERVGAAVAALRDRLADGLLAAVPDSSETGPRNAKIPGGCHLRFAGVESEALVLLLDDAGVCASAGSACASGATEPSHVLAAMGVADAGGALRLSLGRTTTGADVDLALKAVPEAVARLRESDS